MYLGCLAYWYRYGNRNRTACGPAEIFGTLCAEYGVDVSGEAAEKKKSVCLHVFYTKSHLSSINLCHVCASAYYMKVLGRSYGVFITWCPYTKANPCAYHYRGVHVTSILSKVVERVVGAPMLFYFARHICFGLHQWAYRPHRSRLSLITDLGKSVSMARSQCKCCLRTRCFKGLS